MQTQTTIRRLVVLVLATGLALTATIGAQAIDLKTATMEQTDGSFEGVASATYGTCPMGSDIVLLSGSGTDGTWTFSYELNSACDGWMSSGSATGSWLSTAGGCLQPLNRICLNNPMPLAGGAVQYDYVNNMEFHAGTAVVVFA